MNNSNTCPNCGFNMMPGSSVCPRCGFQMQNFNNGMMNNNGGYNPSNDFNNQGGMPQNGYNQPNMNNGYPQNDYNNMNNGMMNNNGGYNPTNDFNNQGVMSQNNGYNQPNMNNGYPQNDYNNMNNTPMNNSYNQFNNVPNNYNNYSPVQESALGTKLMGVFNKIPYLALICLILMLGIYGYMYIKNFSDYNTLNKIVQLVVPLYALFNILVMQKVIPEQYKKYTNIANIVIAVFYAYLVIDGIDRFSSYYELSKNYFWYILNPVYVFSIAALFGLNIKGQAANNSTLQKLRGFKEYIFLVGVAAVIGYFIFAVSLLNKYGASMTFSSIISYVYLLAALVYAYTNIGKQE